MALIELQQVSKVYQQGGETFTALALTDLSIGAGEFVCVAGPSGSGKTTLLNLMGGLDTPSSGRVFIQGQGISGLNRTASALLRRRLIGFVFQSFNLIPVLTAFENVEYVLRLQGVASDERAERVRESLASVGLEAKMAKRPDALSGGEQQRVAVARAVVGRPPIVLADEPTGSLDSKSGAALAELLYELRRRHGTTFVFSSHDPRVINRAERIINICDGRIAEAEAGAMPQA